MKIELSDRELAVITLASQGHTDDMIAHELGIERGTVNSYWVRIRGKLGHLSRTELVARFVEANAERDHQAHVESTQRQLDGQQILLDKANAEINRLRTLLGES